MRVKWSEHAYSRRNQIASYILRQFGAKRKTRFLQDVRQLTRLLRDNPNLGPMEPLYSDRTLAYRSIIVGGLSKMVYRTEGDTIYIVGFWDCRQEPTSQASQTE